jgi:small subunit ribosomal protein S12
LINLIKLSTIFSRINYGNYKRKGYTRTPGLIFRKSMFKEKFKKIRCPHSRSIVIERRQVTPRKPNSAVRKCVKAMLMNYKYLVPYVPGGDHNLRKYGDTLIRGRGPRDLPGVRYSCVRGALGLFGVTHKRHRRSIYGVKRPSGFKKMRRKFRHYYT